MLLFEVIGFASGIAGVWLAAEESPWNWPMGIISVLFYAFVFFNSMLYGDMALQLFYIAVGAYGWYNWIKGSENNKLKIENCGSKTMLYLLLTSVVIFFVVTFLLKKTDTDVPYLDGLTTTLSLSATWMMARKYIEHWLMWIFVDLAYVGLYAYKSLYLTAVLYFIFAVLAIYGFFEWKKNMKFRTI